MTNPLVKKGFEQAKRYLVIQALVIFAVSVFALFQGFMAAVALLSGGLAVLLANLYFVLSVFSKSGAQANKQVVRAFYLGETVKIVISVSLLVLAFYLLTGFEIYVLMGFVLAYLLQWLAPSIVKTH